MPDPRQIINLPVAVTAEDNDLLLMRQGLFDKQVEVSLVRAGLLRSASNLGDVANAATARANLGINLSDFLAASNNLNDLANTTTARANLGVPSTSEAFLVSNNLSEVADAGAARLNLGIDTSDFLAVANDLSDIADPATARSNLGVVGASDAAVTNATNEFGYNIQKQMQLQQYSEKVVAQGNISGTKALDLADGNIHTGTLTGTTTLSIISAAAAGQGSSLFLILTNGGASSLTWDGSIKWPGGTIPSLSTSGTDLLIFVTVDGGTTWYGSLAGKDIK